MITLLRVNTHWGQSKSACADPFVRTHANVTVRRRVVVPDFHHRYVVLSVIPYADDARVAANEGESMVRSAGI